MKYDSLPMSECIDEITMGPFGSNIKVECFTDRGIPVLNGSNVGGFRLTEDSFHYVTPEKAQSLGNAVAHRGDVVITHRGTLGQIAYIPNDSKYDAYVISQSQFRVRCNSRLLPEYMVYYFHTPIGKHQLLSNASQVGVPALARPTSTFQKLIIDVPDIPTQKRIVGVIEALQKKIQTNEKENDNLLQQARVMFRQWLVDNPPTMCKLSELANINPETYSPKDDWSFVNYLDTSSIISGTITEVQHIKPSEEKLPSRARRILRKNDVVFSTVRPNQLHYGIISNPMPNMLGSTGFAVIRSKRASIPNEIIYLALTEPSFVEQMQQLAEQSVSTFPSIRPADLDACLIPDTQEEDMDFISSIQALFSAIASNNEENKCLSTLRDTLLPRLMSGEIDVSKITT